MAPKFAFARWLQNAFKIESAADLESNNVNVNSAAQPQKRKKAIAVNKIISAKPNQEFENYVTNGVRVYILPPGDSPDISAVQTESVVLNARLCSATKWIECYTDEHFSYGYYLIIEYYTYSWM